MIIVYAYNNSAGGSLSQNYVSDYKTLQNNPITITNTIDSMVNEGTVIYVNYGRRDTDDDIATFSCNRTDLFANFNRATGMGSWATGLSDVGTYYVDFGVSDGYGSISNYTMTITVNDVTQPSTPTPTPTLPSTPTPAPTLPSTPPTPTGIASTSGNFWINYTWQAGMGNETDSYNVSVNGIWTNATSDNFLNMTVGPHIWYNISVYSYNSSGNGTLNSNPVIQDTQVANNIPVLISIGNISVNEGSWLNFTIVSLDVDGDIITYGTNATNNSLDPFTGNFNWLTTSSDVGLHVWYFNSSDTYGGKDNETITITVLDITAPSIAFESPTPVYASENRTGYINISVRLNEPGTAILNWNGINESMQPEGIGTMFYNNKSVNLSGNYSFKIFANDIAGNTNVSETIRITVNKTNTVNLTSVTNITTFILNATIDITSPGGNVTITIPNGTNSSLGGFAPLTSISVNSLAQVDTAFVANIGSDKLVGENLSLAPEGAIFSPDIQIRFNYTDAILLSSGIKASDLRVKFYNISEGRWVVQTPYTLNDTGKYITANISHFSTYALIAIPPTLTPLIPTGGGGGGGGGGGSGENASNIESTEKYDLQISKDVLTSYRFGHKKNPIMFIDIIGNTSIGVITTSVEVLKNTSSLVKSVPDGLVYKNLNIWVGTSGFATPRNIKDALIKFKVDNKWMSENGLSRSDIVLMKWSANRWIYLETKILSKDDTFTYFETNTQSFSNFAIAGLKGTKFPTEMQIKQGYTGNSENAGNPEVTTTKKTDIPKTPAEVKRTDPKQNIIYVIDAIVIIGIAAYFILPQKRSSK
jgi:PGF-pre-PGF domain-containing protein